MKKIAIILFYIFFQSNAFADLNINFSNQEVKWLKEHSSITVGIDRHFTPIEFVDENEKFQGLSHDYLLELEKILNIKFNIVKTKKWNEIIDMTKKGSIDILSCIVPTEQRAKYLNFTKPYLSVPMVIVTNKSIGFINGIKDLENKTVAVINGYTPQELLESNHKNIHLVKTKNLSESLELVASGKTFAHVGNLSRVVYLLKEEGFQNLSITGMTNYKYHFSIGIKKDDPILQSILEKGLDSIPQHIKDEIYYKWFPLEYKQVTDYTLVIYISITTVIIILLFIGWVYKFKKDMKRKELIEKQLKNNVKWLNSSLKNAEIAAWNWDLRTNTITGNCVYAKILGIENEQVTLSTKEFQKEFIHKEDLPLVLKELEDYFNNVVKSCSAEFRIHTKDGKLKKVESKGEIFQYDDFNNPAVLFGFTREIKD